MGREELREQGRRNEGQEGVFASACPVDVTVVVPCYNVERYLDQCLSSVEASRSARLEILVLNDGSTDGSLEIMRAHERKDPRVRVIDKANQGYGATVNRGIDEARGAYVAIAEPDDYVEGRMYDELFRLACEEGDPDVVKSSYWRVIPRRNGVRRAHCWYYRQGKAPQGRFRISAFPRLLQYHPSIWSALYRRSYLRANGIRFIEAPGGGWVDNPFLVEVMLKADAIAYTEDAFYCYREDVPGSSTSLIDPLLMVKRWEQRQDIVDQLQCDDEGILGVQVAVGLSFAEDIFARGSLPYPVEEALTGMLRRMGEDAVRHCAEVSPSVRARCLKMLGAADRSVPAGGYRKRLLRKLLWSLRFNGVGFVAEQVFCRRA